MGVVAPEFPPDVGGVENYSLGYVTALASLGHPVTVFTQRHSAGEISIPGVRIEPILKLRKVLDLGIVRNSRIQAWHVTNAAYSWMAEETSIPVVVSVHGNDFLRAYQPITAPALYRFPGLWRWERGLRHLETAWCDHTTRQIRRWLPKARAILTNSRYTEQVLWDKIPACRGKTFPAMVGVDPFYLALPLPGKRPPGPPHLLSIARLSEPRKNIHLVIEALARLRKDFAFRYTVVGEGKERPALEAQARQLGLSDQVHFTGPLPRDALRDLLYQADLFVLTSSVLPTSHEGFGLVYLEAAACGVPSLAARQAGAAEAIDEGHSGLFVERPGIGEISAALRRFLSGEVRFDPHQCREFALRFSWEKVVRIAQPFYEESPPRPGSAKS